MNILLNLSKINQDVILFNCQKYKLLDKFLKDCEIFNLNLFKNNLFRNYNEIIYEIKKLKIY